MAGKIPGRGEFDIPSSLIDEHEWVSDAFIDGEFGTTCTLIYPPSDNECPNCILDLSTGRSSNIYKSGGPIPFTNHTLCPWCGGEGRYSEALTGEIRLRVYFGGMEVNAAMRQFQDLKIADNAAGLVYVIGYMHDAPNFSRSDGIIIINKLTRQEIKCARASRILPWGFRRDRYFCCMLKIE